MENQNETTPRFRPNHGLKLMGEVLRYYHAPRALVCGLDCTVRPFPWQTIAQRPFPRRPKIEALLTDLAVHGSVAAAPQSLAMNARGSSTRASSIKRCRAAAMPCADKQINVPVVMTREEVAAVLSRMHGTAQPVAKLLYGSSLHVMGVVRRRGKDLDVQTKLLTSVRTRATRTDSPPLPHAHPCVLELPGRGQDTASGAGA
jgi:hypothetical protein